MAAYMEFTNFVSSMSLAVVLSTRCCLHQGVDAGSNPMSYTFPPQSCVNQVVLACSQ
jgi:hypothetical protein